LDRGSPFVSQTEIDGLLAVFNLRYLTLDCCSEGFEAQIEKGDILGDGIYLVGVSDIW